MSSGNVYVDFNTYAPQHWLGGYIAGSYLISALGSITTFELLHRRTSRSGLFNWYCLITATISMGGIAIWSMYFIGNRAIELYDGTADLQIAYSPGFTALSFFVPIIVLILAFSIMGSNQNLSLRRVVPGSLVVGGAIVGMHYIGQSGISNYSVSYREGYVAGSVVIALVASVLAFTSLFSLKAQWKDALWKRVILGFIFSGAVSGMHWCASAGSQYRFIPNGEVPNSASRTATVVVTIVMAVAACAVLILFAYATGRKHYSERRHAQEISLASATFDPDGKVMVTYDGKLPCRRIIDGFYEKSSDKLFTSNDAAFHWIYRASWNWASVIPVIPGMRHHIKNFNSDQSRVQNCPLFCERYCVTAEDLADMFREPLEKIGVLYDQIVQTGRKNSGWKDVESTRTNKNGQLLFLTRQMTGLESERMMANGFRFAEIDVVSEILSRSKEFEKSEMTDHLLNMRIQANVRQALVPGVYLGCFALKINGDGSPHILVREKARNLLPSMKLPLASLEPWQSEFIQSQSDKSVSEILHLLRQRQLARITEGEQHFLTLFHGALASLAHDLNCPEFQDAVLIPHQISIPCPLEGFTERNSSMIVLKMVVPKNLDLSIDSSKFTFVPLGLFKAAQSAANGMEMDEFARQIHRDFSGNFVVKENTLSQRKSLLPFAFQANHDKRTLSSKQMAENPSRTNPFEAVLVSKSVDVSVSEKPEEHSNTKQRSNFADAFYEVEDKDWVDDILTEFNDN